jgi:hypothetical protein
VASCFYFLASRFKTAEYFWEFFLIDRTDFSVAKLPVLASRSTPSRRGVGFAELAFDFLIAADFLAAMPQL